MSEKGLNCRVPGDWIADVSMCWFEWQTLIAGVLALAAALTGVFFLSKQIRLIEGQRLDDLARRHNGARVVLPLALSSVNNLVDQVAIEIATEIEGIGPQGWSLQFQQSISSGQHRRSFQPVNLPEETQATLSKFVETCDLSTDVRHVGELLSSLQVLLARFSKFDIAQAGVVHLLYDLLIQAAKVRLLNDSIYGYARLKSDESFGLVGSVSNQVAWEKIRASAHSLVFKRASPDLFFQGIDQLIEHAKSQDLSPWQSDD